MAKHTRCLRPRWPFPGETLRHGELAQSAQGQQRWQGGGPFLDLVLQCLGASSLSCKRSRLPALSNPPHPSLTYRTSARLLPAHTTLAHTHTRTHKHTNTHSYSHVHIDTYTTSTHRQAETRGHATIQHTHTHSVTCTHTQMHSHAHTHTHTVGGHKTTQSPESSGARYPLTSLFPSLGALGPG